MAQIISALFDTAEAAHRAVRDLETAGIPNSDISLIAKDDEGHLVADGHVGEDAGIGAGIGAVAGGAGGLLTGLGLIAIPGVGPVVAAGWLIAAAAGAAAGGLVGGAAGGLIGALTKEGVPDEQANLYAEGLRRGGSLVTARVDNARAFDAQSILERHKSVDLAARGAAYRSEGWVAFDENAPLYSPGEIELRRERDLTRADL